MNGLLTAALDYARRGLAVLPLQPHGKAPCGHLVPHGVKNATTDPATIRDWWQREHRANIGLRTGCGLTVLDVDPRHGGDRALSAHLHTRSVRLAPTPEVATGGGGSHYYFAAPEHLRSARLPGGGLELKADGGYVVAPPSIHPTGPRYTWQNARDLEHLAPARLPHWLLELAAPTTIAATAARGRPVRHEDALREIPAAEYVLALTGRTANRASYVRCPLHKAGQERTPSLRLYDHAGWYCYGCHTGGDIFTLAALLRGLRPPLRGTDFLIVQAALREHFGPPPTTRASRAPQTAKSGA
jgi:hypothetical protein